MTDSYDGPQNDEPETQTEERGQRSNRAVRIIVGTILALLILLLIGVSYFIVNSVTPGGVKGGLDVGNSSGMVWVRSIYGFGPALNQQMQSPLATAVSPDSTIWGGGSLFPWVAGFNPLGNLRRLIQAPANKPKLFARINGIATDSQGNVYVADFQSNVIKVISPANQLVAQWPVGNPLGIAVSGNRVVITSGAGFVTIFDLQGNRLLQFGSRGAGPLQFNGPNAVAIGPNGTMYIADTYNKRVAAYSDRGNLLWLAGKASKVVAGSATVTASVPGGQPGFQVPTGITVDGKGRVVVIDAFGMNVTVLDPAARGAFVAQYGNFGNGDNQFAYPTGIAYDPTHDWFIAADTYNNRLGVFRLPGSAANPTRAWLARQTLAPVWVCCLPLILLIVALAIAVSGRRRRARDERLAEESITV